MLLQGRNSHCISIHAPARGATDHPIISGGNLLFQSTLPRGERLDDVLIFSMLNDFNPRSREGSDDRSGERSDISRHFNPRSREGSDTMFSYAVRCTFISIHAPARGATQHICGRRTFLPFQSTLPRGERHETVKYF